MPNPMSNIATRTQDDLDRLKAKYAPLYYEEKAQHDKTVDQLAKHAILHMLKTFQDEPFKAMS